MFYSPLLTPKGSHALIVASEKELPENSPVLVIVLLPLMSGPSFPEISRGTGPCIRDNWTVDIVPTS